MTIAERQATANHEAGHAVISYLVGLKFMYIAMWDDTNGEVVPESASCDICMEFYPHHDPQQQLGPNDDVAKYQIRTHSKTIQNWLRRDAAVAVVGEIAEQKFAPGAALNPAELQGDRQKARYRASAIHLWSDSDCYLLGGCTRGDPCTKCDQFLNSLRAYIAQRINDPQVWSAVEALAAKLARPECVRLSWDEALGILQACNLGTAMISETALPPPP